MTDSQYDVVQLPRLQDQGLAQRHRDFRLHALKTEPAAFAALYDEEKEKDMQHTFDRLTNPKAAHFVALQSQRGGALDGSLIARLLASTWSGMIVLLGPQKASTVSAKADPFRHMTTEDDQCDDSDASLHFHLNGMFVDHSARGQGLARLLMRHALKEAHEQAKAANRGLICTVIVDDNNAAACALYMASGLQIVAKQEYTKRLVTPNGVCEEEWIALTMEYRKGLEG